MKLSEIVDRYISEFELAIVPIPRGHKGPTDPGWNKPGGYYTDPDSAVQYFQINHKMNIGAVLGPSKIVSLDIDDVEWANHIFSEFGIDIFALKEACPTIIGNPARFRIWFRAPEGVDLKPHKITWPLKEPIGDRKTFTVFELRGGAVQDVIPPSIHPDTGQPYTWHTKITKGLTELPDDILNFWLNWDVFKKAAEELCPWVERPQPKQSKPSDQPHDDAIGRYNQENNIVDALLRYGYRRIGKRYLSPNSSTNIPGVILFEDNRCWNHHASDMLCSDDTGKPISPFDLFLHYEHNGDYKSALKAINPDWKPTKKPIPRKQEVILKDETVQTGHYIDHASPLPYVNSKGKPLAHIDNLVEIIARLGVIVRYNVIKKEDEILVPGKSFTTDNKENASLAWLTSECSRFDFSTQKITDFIIYIADQNLFNPVAQWITSKPWDGVERLLDLYNTIHTVNPADNAFKEVLIRKWMIAAIAAAFSGNGVSAPGVLVLQGEQYLGKTKWFKSLVPEELDVIKEGWLLNPSDKDSVDQACSHWLVELGEIDSTFKKADIAALKAFITNRSDIFRRAFVKKKSRFARRTVFFGSVNPRQYLNDPTGNRRFWTIECKAINHTHGLDMQQIWAEVLTLYKDDNCYFLTNEEMDKLNNHNEQFVSSNTIVERINVKLNWDEPKSLWTFRTATEILMEIGIDKPTNSEATAAGIHLRRSNGGESKSSNRGTLHLCPSLKVR